MLNSPVTDTAGGRSLVRVRVPMMLVRSCCAEEEGSSESVDAATVKGWVCAHVDCDCVRPRRERKVVARGVRRIFVEDPDG